MTGLSVGEEAACAVGSLSATGQTVVDT
jgi:hypothetical protein